MKLISLILLLLPFTIYSQLATTMENTIIKLNDSTLTIHHQYTNVDSSILYLNIHEDEQTSIEAIRTFNKTKNINFSFIEHHKTRRISFNVKNKPFSFDPNRIYTRKGRRHTLEPKHFFNCKAKKSAKFVASHITGLISRYDIIVTLHNNTDVNYSIKSYLPGEDESENTAEVYVNETWDADDFIYTTEKNYFDYLKKEGVNVILQKQTGYVNDGSLSIYCGKKNIKYINIEAQKGHLNEQIKLIEIIDEMLKQLK